LVQGLLNFSFVKGKNVSDSLKPSIRGFRIGNGGIHSCEIKLMKPEITQFVKAGKRLHEAEGYLDFGLGQQALDCLEGLNTPEPLAPAVAMLRSKALWMEKRYGEAVDLLKTAADDFPTPLKQNAWLAVSYYYRQAGDTTSAVQNLARARGAKLPHPHRRSES